MSDEPNRPLPDTQVPDTQEFFEAHSQLAALNAKRTYDTYQDLDLQAARQRQTELAQLNNVALQALQNAVETSNLVAKQAVKHGDVAADALWNPVQQGVGDDLTAGAVPANRVTDTAAAGVAATIPASSDIRIVAVMEALTAQITALAQIIQNAKQTA